MYYCYFLEWQGGSVSKRIVDNVLDVSINFFYIYVIKQNNFVDLMAIKNLNYY